MRSNVKNWQSFKKRTLFRTLFFLIVLLILATKSTAYEFNDLTPDSLFYEHILNLKAKGILIGDTDILGNPKGTFRPREGLSREEYSKLVAVTRLAEEKGSEENWESTEPEFLERRFFEHTKNYLNCSMGACAKINGKEFSDAKGIPFDCLNQEDPETSMHSCQPWYIKFIYFGVDRGYLQGYGNGTFGVTDTIKRIHAIKTMIVENGHIDPQTDERYIALNNKANEKKSFTPPCLAGAENYIRTLNGGNTENANKLLKNALMADRLNFFGGNCEVFLAAGIGKEDKLGMALYLQDHLTRQEAARYFSLSSLYAPVEEEAEADETINNEGENEAGPASQQDYEIPEYDEQEALEMWEEIEKKIEKGELKQIIGKEMQEEIEKEAEEQKKLPESKILEEETLDELFPEEEKQATEPPHVLVKEDAIYIPLDALNEEEIGLLREGAAVDTTQEHGITYVNVKQLEEELGKQREEVNLIKIDKPIQLCTSQGICTTAKKGEKLDLVGAVQKNGEFWQGVGYNGVYYLVSCEVIQSDQCKELLAEKRYGRCCEAPTSNGNCKLVAYGDYKLEKESQHFSENQVWYKARKADKACYVPINDLLHGYKENEDVKEEENLGICPFSDFDKRLITKYLEVDYIPLNLAAYKNYQVMVREIWNSPYPAWFKMFMQIGLDESIRQAKALNLMTKNKSYNCADFEKRFIHLASGHVAIQFRLLNPNELGMGYWEGLFKD